MVQVQEAYWLKRYLNVQYLMLYNKPLSNNEKVSRVRYRTVCVNYLTNCTRELPVLCVCQIHFSTWQFYWLCFAISFLFLFFQMSFMIRLLTLWPFKSLVFCCCQSNVQFKCQLQDSVVPFGCTGATQWDSIVPFFCQRLTLWHQTYMYSVLWKGKKFSGCSYIACSWRHLFITSHFSHMRHSDFSWLSAPSS